MCRRWLEVVPKVVEVVLKVVPQAVEELKVMEVVVEVVPKVVPKVLRGRAPGGGSYSEWAFDPWLHGHSKRWWECQGFLGYVFQNQSRRKQDGHKGRSPEFRDIAAEGTKTFATEPAEAYGTRRCQVIECICSGCVIMMVNLVTR